MSEAVENLNAVHEAHKREVTQLQTSANQQCGYIYIHLHATHKPLQCTRDKHAHTAAKRESESLQQTIQERNGEVRQLQKQLSDMERDKHTELVKLRLEVYTSIHM